MTLDLDHYEAAFERVERSLQLQRDWGASEARIRRRLNRPTWQLVGTLLSILVCVVAGLNGVGSAWLVAGGLALAALPNRVAGVRDRQRTLAAIDSAEEVRALCLKEAEDASLSAFTRFLLLGGLGLAYLLFGLVLGLLGKNPWPGVIAGGLGLGWGVVNLLVVLPRAVREEAALRGDDDDEDEDEDEDEDDDEE